MTLAELLGAKRGPLVQLAIEHGITSLRVFGSAARGQAGPESDVDLLVELEAGRTLLDLIAFEQDAEELLGRKVDVVAADGVSPHLRDRILHEAVVL